MAAVIDIDTGFRTRAICSIDAGLVTIETSVAMLGPTDAVAELQRAQRHLAGLEYELLADHIHDDGNTRDTEKLLKGSKASRATKRKKIGRAKAINKNAALAKKLADDEIGEEQLDLIAEAADKSDGAAATDDELINDIAGADPDAGRAIKDDWLAKRATADGTQTEHDRQRALRRKQAWTSKKTGLGVSALEGDGISQKDINDAIRVRSNQIYQRDGGCDLPASKHPRTRTQRDYDAAYELICGVTTRPDGTTQPANNNNNNNNNNTDADADINNKTSPPASGGRPNIVVGLTIDKFIGNDPAQVARQFGLGAIPDSVLAHYAEHADIFAALFDRNGEPLWLARMRRNASNTQYIALVLRDRCCVQCAAPAAECDVHHRIPWNAPAKGQTNLNNLVLLCRRCHTTLHAQQQTLYQDAHSRQWRTRPATPNETPPPRPKPRPPQQE